MVINQSSVNSTEFLPFFSIKVNELQSCSVMDITIITITAQPLYRYCCCIALSLFLLLLLLLLLLMLLVWLLLLLRQ